MKRRRKIIPIILLIIFIGIFGFSSVKFYQIYSAYKEADTEYEELRKYKPEETKDTDTLTDNKSVIELQEKYPDVVGWLTIDGTNVDYPFAQGKDNSEYLRTTLDGKYIISGTLFMDYQCKKDFSGFNTIIYGHRMNNGTMFGEFYKFGKEEYFNEHTSGRIYLAHETYEMNIIAYMVLPSTDKTVYDTNAEKETYMSYVKEKARQYRETEIGENDTVVTLSTCNHEYDGARSIIVAKINKS